MPRLSLFGCFALLLMLLVAPLCAEDWPQWRGVGRDGVWKESGVVDKFENDQLEIRWRKPLGPGYSGPTVADDRVFITDRQTEPSQVERVLCYDAPSGALLWKHEYPCRYTISYTAGPRAAVTVDDGRAFALGAMGHLHCFDVGGAVLWKKDLSAEYNIEGANRMPIWGIAAAPLVYDDLLILQIGGDDGACIVALDKTSGEEQWRALRDRAQYSAPILIEQAGKDVVVFWTGDSVAGLNPETGEVYWRFPFAPRKMPIGIATPIVSEDRLFVTSFYDGSLMLRLKQDEPAVEQLWQRCGISEKETDALQSIISTPIFQGDYVYGCDSYGELRCLEAATGDRVWEDQTATPRNRWSNIHFVKHDDEVWMFNEAGELVISRLSPRGFTEIDRAKLIDPTTDQLRRRDGVTWAHPAFADRCVFIRNDKEIVCASLAEGDN
ncbi:MAG: PQQ-like beta-propeller repeat protein [Pirellulaceae bacterium]